jgi:hypothetical protein
LDTFCFDPHLDAVVRGEYARGRQSFDTWVLVIAFGHLLLAF